MDVLDQTDTSVAAVPSRARLGLRAKTVVVLLSITLVVVLLAIAIGNYLVEDIRRQLGAGLIHNHARLTQQRLLSAVGRELALSQRLAESVLLQEWLADESDPARVRRFARESENFRRAFAGRSFFVVSALSRNYYFSDEKTAPRASLRYSLKEGNPDDAWFFATLRKADGYSVNVDHDKKLKVTNVWINVVVRDAHGRPLGIAGTGLELTQFLTDMLRSPDPGVLTMIVDASGAIVAHPDITRIEYATAGKEKTDKTIFRLVADAAERESLSRALGAALDDGTEATVNLHLQGQSRMVAIAPIPGLKWAVVATVDLGSSRLFAPQRVIGVAVVGMLLLLLLVAAVTVGFDGLVLRPLAQLTRSVRKIGAGQYDVHLTSARRDELGELTRAFDAMADRVRVHSENLERLVDERTAELSTAHEQVAEAHRKLTDSIRYASLIQSAILPDRALGESFRGEYFVLWQPRDVVGGDFYLYRSDSHGCLFGVVDCAGHGVPGACMTMIGHAALEVATGDTRWNDPAALLRRTDEVARSMLPGHQKFGRIATSMDMGLCHVDLRGKTVTFAGARLSLLWSDGGDCFRVSGSRTGINDRKTGDYHNSVVPLERGRTFYLTTDGLLDQAGGERSHAFGGRRLAEWVGQNAARPLAEQKERLAATIASYRGEHPQRDDLTVLAFRFNEEG